jgi:hypothetical protein
MNMKWNLASVAGACVVVGVLGFVIGKLTTKPTAMTEEERLLETSRNMGEQRMTSSSDERTTTRSNRPMRPGSIREEGDFDQKLERMEEIVRGENALSRNRALLDWIDSLAPEEFESAVDRFRSLGLTEARMGEYAMLLTAWAEIDPVGALAYTTEKTRGGMATGTVIAAWANRDPDAAIAWAKANHEGDGANPYMIGIIRGMAETNPERATLVLQELPFSSERAEALDVMIPHILRGGSESAKKWITGITDERLRNGAIARLAEGMAKENPADTASWLLANLNETSVRSFDEVYSEWAKKDKTAALSAFKQLPEGDARSRALRGMVTVEAQQDPAAAASLMNSFPNDVDDSMVMHFAWNSFEKAPDVALSQVGLMQNKERRDRMYIRGLESWMNEDQEAAKRWMNSAKLPDNVIEALSQRDTP